MNILPDPILAPKIVDFMDGKMTAYTFESFVKDYAKSEVMKELVNVPISNSYETEAYLKKRIKDLGYAL